MALAKVWMDDCIGNHERCPGPSHQMPTRVIRVGLEGMKPVLYVTESEHSSYVALIHCWGNSPILCTTTTTIAQRKEGMPMESLPKTFYDAIVITRKLGIEYLWIDSLRILQDSEDDWARESARIAQVYSGATVVIAADAARNSADGCFGPYEYGSNRNASISIPCVNNQGSYCHVYVRMNRSKESAANLEHIAPDFLSFYKCPDLPLTLRGWW
jgi:hypothetical protein